MTPKTGSFLMKAVFSSSFRTSSATKPERLQNLIQTHDSLTNYQKPTPPHFKSFHFFLLSGIVGSTIAGVFLLILLILFCIYRLRKRDEGSYSLDEPKKSPTASNSYTQAPDREFYA
ncbi:unnamed protein product [Schistocephalus solidus]|uniref:4.1m domain-containing protein n=1 Tax=Schistocephalus solidus TaxID=70667 RepID=A0A183SN19_SCHSO|nr:unnamed protein product [Schistocephalus solidus]